MKSYARLLPLLLLAAGCAAPGAGRTARREPPPVEARGVWVHVPKQFGADPAAGRPRVRAFIDAVADARFNLVVVWISGEYLAALEDPAYREREPSAAWDAVGELVAACRDRGLRVEAWVSFTFWKTPRSPEFDPARGGDPAWASRRRPAAPPAADADPAQAVPDDTIDLCPNHDAARAWEIRQFEGMLDRYPGLAGIHLEEPGYGSGEACVCDRCRELFRAKHRKELDGRLDRPEVADLRCRGTGLFVRELRERLEARTPRPALTANGSCNAENDRRIGRDWRRWAKEGWIDAYVAQNYTEDDGRFQRRARTVLGDLKGLAPVWMGLGIRWSGGGNTPETLAARVEQARAFGAKGVVVYDGRTLTEPYLAALRDGPFRTPARFPAPKPSTLRVGRD